MRAPRHFDPAHQAFGVERLLKGADWKQAQLRGPVRFYGRKQRWELLVNGELVRRVPLNGVPASIKGLLEQVPTSDGVPVLRFHQTLTRDVLEQAQSIQDTEQRKREERAWWALNRPDAESLFDASKGMPRSGVRLCSWTNSSPSNVWIESTSGTIKEHSGDEVVGDPIRNLLRDLDPLLFEEDSPELGLRRFQLDRELVARLKARKDSEVLREGLDVLSTAKAGPRKLRV